MVNALPFKRLPDSVIPRKYALTLHPDLVNSTFQGTVKITLQIKSEIQSIICNSYELSLSDIHLKLENDVIKPSKVEIQDYSETVSMYFDKALLAREAELTMSFSGILNDKMKGFYRSRNILFSGDEEYAAVTQFEPSYARRCFPCWDEPALKARFDITVIAPSNKVVLSNMDIVSCGPVENDSSLKVVKFNTTPMISTYLLAVIVGEYDFIEGATSNDIKVSVYTPVGKSDMGKYVLDCAIRCISFYEKYLMVPYPLPKLDFIAIADFEAGAMENWGLVTVREARILVDNDAHSARQKQRVAVIIAHEISHQWFGNLVTMEWWTHLWLNEGYASFSEYLSLDELYPEFDIWTQFVTSTFIPALELDCLKSSHPIEVPVGRPAEVEEIFDEISYEKGASVIRMLHSYLGDENFKRGMHLYLSRHQYQNASTEDLWAALSEASEKPVSEVMTSWTSQAGFPVLKVSSHMNGNGRVLTVTQKRFISDGSTDNSTWIIPLKFLSSSSKCKSKEILMDMESIHVTFEGLTEDDWIKLNPNSVGFYRTLYCPEMSAQLTKAIQANALSQHDRLEVLDDLFAMVQANYCPTVGLLRLLQSFENETEYVVWSAISNCIHELTQLLSHTTYLNLFSSFVQNLYSKIHAKLGWENQPKERHMDTLLRGQVLTMLGIHGSPLVRAEAKRKLLVFADGTEALHADIRKAVYDTVCSFADEKTFELMLKMYQEADMHEEKERISRALGLTSDTSLIQRVLEFAMSSEVRIQDLVFVIINTSLTAPGRNAVWSFFRANYEDLMNKYKGGYLIIHLVKKITENFASEDMAVEIERFFQSHPLGSSERPVQQALEKIRCNAAWLARDAESVETFLKQSV